MKPGVWRLLPALLLLLPAPVQADDAVPDAATIRKNIEHAAGTLPDAYRATYETTYADGAKLVERFIRRGDDDRTMIDYGPFHSEEGTFKGESWLQNDNGQTVLDQPAPAKDEPEKTTTTVKRIDAPVHGYVIATLTGRGSGRKEYIDGTTWRLVRREYLSPNGTIATTYDDVRTDHGRTYPHHWHVEDGIERRSSDTIESAYDPSPVTDAEVGIPNPRRLLVQFPDGVTSVTLPTQFSDSDIYVRVTINGRGLDFVLDTGASGITIDETTARQLGLTPYARHSTVTARRHTTARTMVPEVHVGQLTMKNVAMEIIPQAYDTGDNVKVVGLLGFDFLAELGVTIDYEHSKVTVTPEDQYVAPADPMTIPLDVRVGSGQPMTTVSINGTTAQNFLLDTGGAGTFLIFDYFARRHPEAMVDDDLRGARSEHVQFFGIGGNFNTEPYAIKSLQLAKLNFQHFIGYKVTSEGSYDDGSDGLIGTSFLRLFTLGLDYGQSRVYLTPNKDGRRIMKPVTH